jgi:hypothetical protein
MWWAEKMAALSSAHVIMRESIIGVSCMSSRAKQSRMPWYCQLSVIVTKDLRLST